MESSKPKKDNPPTDGALFSGAVPEKKSGRGKKPIRLTDQKTPWGKCLKYWATKYYERHGEDHKFGAEAMTNFQQWIKFLGWTPEHINAATDFFFNLPPDKYNNWHSLKTFMGSIDQYKVRAKEAGYMTRKDYKNPDESGDTESFLNKLKQV